MNLLKKLTQAFAVSGSEDSIHELISAEIASYVDEIYTDNLGNLIAHKSGNGKKILFTAQTDEIGVMVTYIEDNGFLRFAPVGKFQPESALHQKVIFPNGTVGVICAEIGTDVSGELKFTSMYIDIGTVSSEDTLKYVAHGDTAMFIGMFIKTPAALISKSLGCRASVYILIEAAKRIKNNANDLYFVFTSRNQIGYKGNMVVGYNIEPDYAVTVDAVAAQDCPKSSDSAVCLGKGAVLKLMDKSVITHKGLREMLRGCADDAGISCQVGVFPTDVSGTAAIQGTKSGVPAASISIPVRNINTTCETANYEDIKACIKLIEEFCKKDFIFA